MAESKEIFLNVKVSRAEQESIKITIDAEDEAKIKSLKWYKLFRGRNGESGNFTIVTYLSGRIVSLQCVLLGKKVHVRWANGDRTDFRKENLELYGPERPLNGTLSRIAAVKDPAGWRTTDWSDFRSEKWEYDGSPFTDSVKQDPPAPTKQDHSIQEPKVCGFSPTIAEILTSPIEVGADSDAIEELKKARLKRKYGSADGNGFLDLEVVVDHLMCRRPGEAEKADIKDFIKAGLSVASGEDS